MARPSTRTGADACEHCGLPVPAGRVHATAELRFCCAGCEVVYDAIRHHGLDRFYDIAASGTDALTPAQVTGRGYAEFDDPAFRKLYVRQAPGGLETAELYLEGVHCAACVWLVERVPVVFLGVAESRLELGQALARVSWDPRATSLSAIARLFDSLGYTAHPYRGVDVRALRRREDRKLLMRIGVAGAAAGNTMLLAFALYGGMFHGIEAEYEALFRWTAMAIALPAVGWAALPFLRGALGSLRSRAMHMDVPISLGILAGFGWGVWNTLRGSGEVYFESVTVLIFLLLCGRFLQQRSQRAATDSAELLYSLAPSSARVLAGGAARDVPLEALVRGMVVEVRPGESVPVDGVVRAGESTLDTSVLTGESVPVSVRAESCVYAGAVNLSSRIEVRVDAAGEDTRVARLMRLVEESAARRPRLVRLADRLSGAFVSAVLALAALTLVLGWGSDPRTALDNTIALLIITCPCALGLATPLAVSAAIGRAARAGILIKGGDILETLAGSGKVFLDKTGTLTEGRMTLLRWEGSADAARLARALEAQVSHPIARALAQGLEDDGPPLPAAARRVGGGSGVAGTVDGREVLVGSPSYVAGEIGGLSAHAAATLDGWAGEALTPVAVAVDGRLVALAALGDPVREDAAQTLRRLERAGYTLEILSGDHPRVVAAVGRRLGLPQDACHGGVSPERKLSVVRDAARGGTVVMVGDGINDAAALTGATVGVAVQGGAEAALAVADVFMSRPGLEPLADLLAGARRTLRVIRLNLAFSLLYNVLGAALAMSGRIDPLVAAVLMPLSSLAVITHSFRARTFEPPATGRASANGTANANANAAADLRGVVSGAGAAS